MKKILIAYFFLVLSFHIDAQTHINALGNYSWHANDLPRTFSKELKFSFVRAHNGFPSFGTVLAGGSYAKGQDGSVFQLFFPYGPNHGGIAPKVRLGKYNNQGWSDWATFYTSANANNETSDWSTKNLSVHGNVGIGTTETHGYKLGVNGKIAAEEVKVAYYANWPDYVFEEDYQLPSLAAVERHIKENKHLADIPSAATIKEHGFFLGDMDAKLLKKIEELTLYTIDQEKRLLEQQEKIKLLESQQARIDLLAKELQALRDENNKKQN